MIFDQRFVPGLAIASYTLGDEKTGEAVVIDPTRDVDYHLALAKKHDLVIRHIVETHVHADFVCGSRELKARLDDDATIHCSAYGGDDWTQPYADEYVNQGSVIQLGDVRLCFRHTPGHTPEHIAITLFDVSRSAETPWGMFSGDFLFVGDVGRPDLLGKEAQEELAHQLYVSLFERLAEIPDITEIFPAHGAGSLCGKAIGGRRSSTVGYERRYNTSLEQQPEPRWVEQLLHEMPLSPPYFRRMKQINREGPAIIGPESPGMTRWSAKSVYDRVCENCLVLDVRAKEAFAAAHIPDSINIPFGQNLPTWAGWVLPYDTPILIVAEDRSQVDDVVTHLLRVGFDDVQGFLAGGIGAWETAGLPLASLRTMSVHELDARRRDDKRLKILDVRTEREWNSGHIEGAVHIHGGTLQKRIEELEKDEPFAVVCGSGYRASIASSFLKRHGYEDVTNVLGGMSAWQAAGLPTTD